MSHYPKNSIRLTYFEDRDDIEKDYVFLKETGRQMRDIAGCMAIFSQFGRDHCNTDINITSHEIRNAVSTLAIEKGDSSHRAVQAMVMNHVSSLTAYNNEN